MNPVTFVLCVAALCCQLEHKHGWAGAFIFLALVMAGWDNFRGNMALRKLMGRKQ